MSECWVLNAEAYPNDDESIAIDLMHAESEEKLKSHEFTTRRFFIPKEAAQTVATQLMEILAAPSTAAAWEKVFDQLPECSKPDDLFSKVEGSHIN